MSYTVVPKPDDGNEKPKKPKKPKKPLEGQMLIVPAGDDCQRCKLPMGPMAVEARRSKRGRRWYVCLDCFVAWKKEEE